MRQTLRYIDLINKFVAIVLGIMLGIMSIVIVFQVLSRFSLGMPLPWSEELARYLMVYSVFLGAAIALRHQKLISVEVFSERLSWRKRRVLKTIVLLVSIIFFILLFIKGIEMMDRVSSQVSPALQIPMSIPYASVPIGAVMLTLNAIAAIIDMFTNGKEETHEWAAF